MDTGMVEYWNGGGLQSTLGINTAQYMTGYVHTKV